MENPKIEAGEKKRRMQLGLLMSTDFVTESVKTIRCLCNQDIHGWRGRYGSNRELEFDQPLSPSTVDKHW